MNEQVNLADPTMWYRLLVVLIFKLGKKRVFLTQADINSVKRKMPTGTIVMKFAEKGVELRLLSADEVKELRAKEQDWV